MEEIKGIDISVWQKGIDYKALAEAGVKFAILRASYNKSKDTQLDNHVKGCKEQGIDIGYYVYSIARTPAEARAEAKACIDIIKRYPEPTYPIFFDLEESDIANEVPRDILTDCAIAFCEEIQANGYYSGIYANPSWLENYYDKSRLVGKYDIWLAHWTEDPKFPSKYNYGQTMWQWGLDKIGMDIDGDICFIDYPEKIRAWKEGNTEAGENDTKVEEEDTTNNKDDAPTDKADDTATPVVGKQYAVGDAVILNRTPLYYASSSTKPANYISGEYFILSESIIKNKIRITKPKGNTVCTGWVDVSDLETASNTQSDNTATTKPEDLKDIARRVVRGEFGCGHTRVKLLTEAGYDYKEVQKLVNELYYSN